MFAPWEHLGRAVRIDDALRVHLDALPASVRDTGFFVILFGYAGEGIPQIPMPLESPQALAFQNRAHTTLQNRVRKRPQSEGSVYIKRTQLNTVYKRNGRCS